MAGFRFTLALLCAGELGLFCKTENASNRRDFNSNSEKKLGYGDDTVSMGPDSKNHEQFQRKDCNPVRGQKTGYEENIITGPHRKNDQHSDLKNSDAKRRHAEDTVLTDPLVRNVDLFGSSHFEAKQQMRAQTEDNAVITKPRARDIEYVMNREDFDQEDGLKIYPIHDSVSPLIRSKLKLNRTDSEPEGEEPVHHRVETVSKDPRNKGKPTIDPRDFKSETREQNDHKDGTIQYIPLNKEKSFSNHKDFKSEVGEREDHEKDTRRNVSSNPRVYGVNASDRGDFKHEDENLMGYEDGTHLTIPQIRMSHLFDPKELEPEAGERAHDGKKGVSTNTQAYVMTIPHLTIPQIRMSYLFDPKELEPEAGERAHDGKKGVSTNTQTYRMKVYDGEVFVPEDRELMDHSDSQERDPMIARPNRKRLDHAFIFNNDKMNLHSANVNGKRYIYPYELLVYANSEDETGKEWGLPWFSGDDYISKKGESDVRPIEVDNHFKANRRNSEVTKKVHEAEDRECVDETSYRDNIDKIICEHVPLKLRKIVRDRVLLLKSQHEHTDIIPKVQDELRSKKEECLIVVQKFTGKKSIRLDTLGKNDPIQISLERCKENLILSWDPAAQSISLRFFPSVWESILLELDDTRHMRGWKNEIKKLLENGVLKEVNQSNNAWVKSRVHKWKHSDKKNKDDRLRDVLGKGLEVKGNDCRYNNSKTFIPHVWNDCAKQYLSNLIILEAAVREEGYSLEHLLSKRDTKEGYIVHMINRALSPKPKHEHENQILSSVGIHTNGKHFSPSLTVVKCLDKMRDQINAHPKTSLKDLYKTNVFERCFALIASKTTDSENFASEYDAINQVSKTIVLPILESYIALNSVIPPFQELMKDGTLDHLKSPNFDFRGLIEYWESTALIMSMKDRLKNLSMRFVSSIPLSDEKCMVELTNRKKSTVSDCWRKILEGILALQYELLKDGVSLEPLIPYKWQPLYGNLIYITHERILKNLPGHFRRSSAHLSPPIDWLLRNTALSKKLALPEHVEDKRIIEDIINSDSTYRAGLKPSIEINGVDGTEMGNILNARRGADNSFASFLRDPMFQALFSGMTGLTLSTDPTSETMLGGILGRLADVVSYPLIGHNLSNAFRGGMQGAADSVVENVRDMVMG